MEPPGGGGKIWRFGVWATQHGTFWGMLSLFGEKRAKAARESGSNSGGDSGGWASPSTGGMALSAVGVLFYPTEGNDSFWRGLGIIGGIEILWGQGHVRWEPGTGTPSVDVAPGPLLGWTAIFLSTLLARTRAALGRELPGGRVGPVWVGLREAWRKALVPGRVGSGARS